MADLWNHDEPVTTYGIDVPAWIADTITPADVAAIMQGGCASGAYMPAVTYYDASQTMAQYGDDVLQYIEDYSGGLPDIPCGESWSGIAVFFLSYAVEQWCAVIEEELCEAIENAADEEDEDEEDEDDEDE